MQTHIAKIKFTLTWSKQNISHCNETIAEQVNLWHDYLPYDNNECIQSLKQGETYTQQFQAGELVPEFDPLLIQSISQKQFIQNYQTKMPLQPKLGRWYPIDMFEGVHGFSQGNTYPCQIIDQTNAKLLVNFNHPLAQYDLNITSEILKLSTIENHLSEPSQINDWTDIITRKGPGLEALNNFDHNYTTSAASICIDEQDDAAFYADCESASYIDITSAKILTQFNNQFIEENTRVIDFMCGAQSFFKSKNKQLTVTGIGLCEDELKENPALNEFIILDVNKRQKLPFEDNSIDTVICSLAVQYIRDLRYTLKEIHRVLKVGGKVIFNYSEKEMLNKMLNIWKELHPFERMAYILQHLRDTQGFDNLHSHSIIGMHRNYDDPEFKLRVQADQVFNVWAQKT
ncbi:MAG: class I SAM-dependent methyltransferase [Gammaproteobacteria bacterium]|nr:class I SAM-dependent methyltransferase [Gammaproteobacteria bacterium]